MDSGPVQRDSESRLLTWCLVMLVGLERCYEKGRQGDRDADSSAPECAGLGLFRQTHSLFPALVAWWLPVFIGNHLIFAPFSEA